MDHEKISELDLQRIEEKVGSRLLEFIQEQYDDVTGISIIAWEASPEELRARILEGIDADYNPNSDRVTILMLVRFKGKDWPLLNLKSVIDHKWFPNSEKGCKIVSDGAFFSAKEVLKQHPRK